MPSAEHVTSSRPKCLGPNLTSVTEVLESTRFDRFSHVRKLFSEPVAVVSPEYNIEYIFIWTNHFELYTPTILHLACVYLCMTSDGASDD